MRMSNDSRLELAKVQVDFVIDIRERPKRRDGQWIDLRVALGVLFQGSV